MWRCRLLGAHWELWFPWCSIELCNTHVLPLRFVKYASILCLLRKATKKLWHKDNACSSTKTWMSIASSIGNIWLGNLGNCLIQKSKLSLIPPSFTSLLNHGLLDHNVFRQKELWYSHPIFGYDPLIGSPLIFVIAYNHSIVHYHIPKALWKHGRHTLAHYMMKVGMQSGWGGEEIKHFPHN